MLDIVIRVVVNAIAFVAAIKLVPRADFGPDLWKLVLVAAIFGVVNAYLRPIVKTLSIPLSLITLGAVGFVINAAMVLLTGAISERLDLGLRLAGWPVRGEIDLDVIITAVLVSLVVSVVATLLAVVRMVTPRV
ncbi:MAG TPA: phage holin family protein [Candidatus Limnocylindrales bacterium]|nr:phage holin family protein [Candidatus Limnocylindrales bacterium]